MLCSSSGLALEICMFHAVYLVRCLTCKNRVHILPARYMAESQPHDGSSTSDVSGGCSDSNLQLNIKTLDSRIYSFNVDKNMVVSAFKEKIASQSGVPVGQQRLIFRGKVLKDDHLLSEYSHWGSIEHYRNWSTDRRHANWHSGQTEGSANQDQPVGSGEDTSRQGAAETSHTSPHVSMMDDQKEMDLGRVVQRLENPNSSEEIFHSLVDSALNLSSGGSAGESVVNELCSQGELAQEFMEMLHNDILQRLQDEM
ncbi:hypothetical protein Sango_2150700 [Sesamum angolense]|uniref:Ubiquitin-like domain-containing protein n=1 Tax=Sesamum angolense TaxID=2727404 RepID=A0AAE2BMK6_9LAMI|nr:hypothetical protein Sango_2150700 [Sesamum angolense]